MKKALVAVALAAIAPMASAAIALGSHDLSQLPGATISSCQFCHAPHNVNAVGGAPLWNRNLAASGDFTVYTSNTLNDTTVTLGVNSLTCLSCHDGVSDMGATFTGSHGFGGTNTVITTTFADVTRDLTDDHPVGVTFNAGGEFETVANVTAAGLVLYNDGAGGLSVECGSCHDPHGLSDGTAGGLSFLRAAATTICADCHLK